MYCLPSRRMRTKSCSYKVPATYCLLCIHALNALGYLLRNKFLKDWHSCRHVLSLSLYLSIHLRHWKCVHIPCFYQVSVKNLLPFYITNTVCSLAMQKFERTRTAVGTWANRRVFLQLFQVLPNFHGGCFYNSIETRSTCCLFLLENSVKNEKETNLLTLIIKM